MIVVDTYEREPGPSAIRRCTHPTCRTSLDEYATECPHGAPFCEHCTWEDGCEECVLEPMRQRAAAAWEAAADLQPYADPMRDTWVDHTAEQRAEQRNYDYALLGAREEDNRHGVA